MKDFKIYLEYYDLITLLNEIGQRLLAIINQIKAFKFLVKEVKNGEEK